MHYIVSGSASFGPCISDALSMLFANLVQLTSEGWEFVHASKAAKHLIATYPSLIKKVNGVYGKASVLHVGADGKIIKKLDDPDGKVISFVTSAFEFEGHLYLGSLNSNFIGKLPLI